MSNNIMCLTVLDDMKKSKTGRDVILLFID